MDALDYYVIMVLALVLGGLAIAARRAFDPVAPDAEWREDPAPWRALPWSTRHPSQARERHEIALRRQLATFGGSGVVHVERVENGSDRGDWRAWWDAEHYGLAPENRRAQWGTRAGALRLLLRATLDKGGAWTQLACEPCPEPPAPRQLPAPREPSRRRRATRATSSPSGSAALIEEPKPEA